MNNKDKSTIIKNNIDSSNVRKHVIVYVLNNPVLNETEEFLKNLKFYIQNVNFLSTQQIDSLGLSNDAINKLDKEEITTISQLVFSVNPIVKTIKGLVNKLTSVYLSEVFKDFISLEEDLINDYMGFNKVLERELRINNPRLLEEALKHLVILNNRAEGKTLEASCEEFVLTRERARQIEKKYQFAINEYLIKDLFTLVDEYQFGYIPADFFNNILNKHNKVINYLVKNSSSIILKQDYDIIIFNNEYFDAIEKLIRYCPDIIEKAEIESYYQEVAKKYHLIYNLHLQKEIFFKVFNSMYIDNNTLYTKEKLYKSLCYNLVVGKHFKDGIRIYNKDDVEKLREKFREMLNENIDNNSFRSIGNAIMSSCFLLDKGLYTAKRQVILTNAVIEKIRNYIQELDRDVFTDSELFYLFEDELIECGCTNKFTCLMELKHIFKDEYFFQKNYLCKNQNASKIYDYIEEFIKKSNKNNLSLDEIRVEFPNLTFNVLNGAIKNNKIIPKWGRYYNHVDNIFLSKAEKQAIKKYIENKTQDKNLLGAKAILADFETLFPNFIKNNNIDTSYYLYSILSAIYEDDFSFKRPFIAQLGTNLLSRKEMLNIYAKENEVIKVRELRNFADENEMRIDGFKKCIRDANKTMLLVDRYTLATFEYIGVDENIHLQVEDTIINRLIEQDKEAEFLIYLDVLKNLPEINIEWTEWTIFSMIEKWGDKLRTETVFNKSASQSFVIVALKDTDITPFIKHARYLKFNKRELDNRL